MTYHIERCAHVKSVDIHGLHNNTEKGIRYLIPFFIAQYTVKLLPYAEYISEYAFEAGRPAGQTAWRRSRDDNKRHP